VVGDLLALTERVKETGFEKRPNQIKLKNMGRGGRRGGRQQKKRVFGQKKCRRGKKRVGFSIREQRRWPQIKGKNRPGAW